MSFVEFRRSDGLNLPDKFSYGNTGWNRNNYVNMILYSIQGKDSSA